MSVYGVGIAECATGIWGHGGQTLGFNSALLLAPEHDVVAAALTNAAKGPATEFRLKAAGKILSTPAPD